MALGLYHVQCKLPRAWRKLLAQHLNARRSMNRGDEILVSDMRLDLTLVLSRNMVF
jgi:hypothetical protein